MKINYISMFDPSVHHGGGEMIAWDVIESGRLRGHTFTISSARPKVRMEFDETAEIDFLVDIYNYPATLKSQGAWKSLPDDLLERVLKRNRFIHMSNAYVDVCNLPYLPCSGDSHPICGYKSPLNVLRNIAAKDFSANCFASRENVQDFFSKSLLNIFLSPLHQDTCLKILGLVSPPPSFVLKPTVDKKLFFNMGMERDIDYLFVGIIGEAKGLGELRTKYGGKDIHLAGRVYPGEKLDFGTYHGAVPYTEIPLLMNRTKNFVFLPRWPEPQGRVVIEAALCGCNLVTNENVGATSFPFDISNPDNFGNATEDLWTFIEGI